MMGRHQMLEKLHIQVEETFTVRKIDDLPDHCLSPLSRLEFGLPACGSECGTTVGSGSSGHCSDDGSETSSTCRSSLSTDCSFRSSQIVSTMSEASTGWRNLSEDCNFNCIECGFAGGNAFTETVSKVQGNQTDSSFRKNPTKTSAARRERRKRAAQNYAKQNLRKVEQGFDIQPDGQSKLFSKKTNSTDPWYTDALAKVEQGGDVVFALWKDMQTWGVDHLVNHDDGCRVVQALLSQQAVPKEIKTELCKELHGKVRNAVQSGHGNYVVQKLIEVMPPEQSYFVAWELYGDAVSVSQHEFGCRIMCRLLEHCAEHPCTIWLVAEILPHVGTLYRHKFGHHVVESILSNCGIEQRLEVAFALQHYVIESVLDEHGSFVLTTTLRVLQEASQHGCIASASELWGILGRLQAEENKERLLDLRKKPIWGPKVIKKLLKYLDARSPIYAAFFETNCR